MEKIKCAEAKKSQEAVGDKMTATLSSSLGSFEKQTFLTPWQS